MTKLLREIGLDCEFEQLTLSRINCCLDFFPESQKWSMRRCASFDVART